MTPIEAALARVRELREAEKRMTTGKWSHCAENAKSLIDAGVYADGIRVATMTAPLSKLMRDKNTNAAGIAALRNAAPALLDLLEALLENHRGTLGQTLDLGARAEVALAAFVEEKDAT